MQGRGNGGGLAGQLAQRAQQGERRLAELHRVSDLEVELAQQRVNAGVAGRGLADRIDSETRDFHERVRRGYLELASRASAAKLPVPLSGSGAVQQWSNALPK